MLPINRSVNNSMELDIGGNRRESDTSDKSYKSVKFNVQESVVSIVGSSNPLNHPNSSKSVKNRSFKKYSEDIKLELLKLSTWSNLLLIFVYVLLCIHLFVTSIQQEAKSRIQEGIRCHIDELDNVTWTFHQKQQISSAKLEFPSLGCLYYELDYRLLVKMSFQDALDEVMEEISQNKLKIRKCNILLYDNNASKEFSIVKQFDLACDRRMLYYLNFFAQVGGAIVAFPSGIVSDMFGRKPVFSCGAIIAVIGSSISCSTSQLSLFIVGRTIIGAGTMILMHSLMVIFTELCRNKYRSAFTVFAFIGWYIGDVVQKTVLVVHIKRWRFLTLADDSPYLIILFGIMIIPESPRWLMQRKEWKKVWNVLQAMGSTEYRDSLPESVPINTTVLKQLRIFGRAYFQYRTSICIIISGIASLTYYMSLLVANKESLDKISITVSMACIKIVFLLLICRAVYSYSKRSICCSLFLLLATCFISSMLIESTTLNNAALLLEETLATAVNIVALVYVLEIFPTTHRATAFGMNLSIAQFIRLTILHFHFALDLTTNLSILKGFFGSFCLICALVTIVAPTSYQDIPDTKEDLIKDLTIAEQVAFGN